MDGGEAMVDLARTFGVDRATLYRLQAAGSRQIDISSPMSAALWSGRVGGRRQAAEQGHRSRYYEGLYALT